MGRMTNPSRQEGDFQGMFPQVRTQEGWCPSGEFKSPLGHQQKPQLIWGFSRFWGMCPAPPATAVGAVPGIRNGTAHGRRARGQYAVVSVTPLKALCPYRLM